MPEMMVEANDFQRTASSRSRSHRQYEISMRNRMVSSGGLSDSAVGEVQARLRSS